MVEERNFGGIFGAMVLHYVIVSLSLEVDLEPLHAPSSGFFCLGSFVGQVLSLRSTKEDEMSSC